MMYERALGFVCAVLLSPFLLGVVNRTKAKVAGRKGQPLLQLYFDLFKLMRKGVVYSKSTTFLFRLGPWVGLACVLLALLLVPMTGASSLVSFGGDLILMAYLLGLARFFTVLAALDTGSAFEGMGASREVQFSMLAEPALFMALLAVARLTGAWSLSEMSASVGQLSGAAGVTMGLVGMTLFLVLLSENSRIPVDDPTTHLELTMIHEVMVLDHSGPELSGILYGAALKLWLFAALLVSLLVPMPEGHWALQAGLWVACVFCVAIGVGLVESGMARLRLVHVPRLLVGAGVLSLVAVFLG